MPSRCPNCHHPVASDAAACPNCPESWESEEDAEYRRRNAPRFGVFNTSGPGMIVLLAAAALFFAWRTLSFVMTWGNSDSKNSPIARLVEKRTRIPLPDNPRVLDGPAAPSGPNAAEEEGNGAAAALPPVAAASRGPQGAPARWRFRGYVYDLTTLAPVSHCLVDFSDPNSGARFETSTDGDGLYRVEIPPLSGHGYTVKIRAGGYASSYLDPGTENVPRLGEAERRSLARELNHSLDGPYDVEAQSEAPVATDFYLAPVE